MAKKSIEQLDKNLKAKAVRDADALRWRDATQKPFTVRGLAWHAENKGRLCRLPLRAEGTVRGPVWDLAQHTAGARIAFRSDATNMAVRVTNTDAGMMPHMPLTGQRGVALYAGEPGRMRYWVTGIPEQGCATFERPLFEGITKKLREYRLYLPLYKGVDRIEIALNKGARVLPPSPPALPKPLVVYGTSITHGGCASTAGGDFPSALGRRLNLDTINLGFSGNGKGETEMAELIREVDAALYVLDYAANVDNKRLHCTLPRFVKALRAKRPETPILMVTSPFYARSNHSAQVRRDQEAKRDTMIAAYARLRKQGDANVHLADGWALIPFGTEGAYVDGVHPTEHGFQLMADRLAPFVDMILLSER